jgi:membrane-associated phospholipid phosphatase
MTLRTFVALFFLVSLTVILSHFYLDAPIALFFNKELNASSQLGGPIEHLTHLASYLFLIVCAIGIGGWAVYLWLRYSGIENEHRRFFQLISITVPSAFLLKSFLQDVFGAPSPHVWLDDPGRWGFHWYSGAGYLNAFPSGHMAVFTPLFIALWRYYPRYRHFFLALWLLLAGGLIATDSHFLSDVIAGAYLGFLVDFYAGVGLSIVHESRAGGR